MTCSVMILQAYFKIGYQSIQQSQSEPKNSWQKMGLLPGYRRLAHLEVFVVFLELFLPILKCNSHIPPGFASYDVIIPRQLLARTGKASQDQISYVIKADGKTHIVHLKKKTILIKKFPVFTYKNNKLQINYHAIQDECYYRGYIEGATDSFVTLSVCSGLRGLLQVENVTYTIDPLTGSSTFQHLVYRKEDEGSKSWRCGLSSEAMPYEIAGLMRGQISGNQNGHPHDPWKHTRYMELFLVVDVYWYRKYGSSLSSTIYEMTRLNQIVDDMYAALGLRILLVGLEIWMERNMFPITNNAKSSLNSFSRWKIKAVVPLLNHDVSLLLSALHQGRHPAAHSYFGTVCDPRKGAAFIGVSKISLQHLAITVAHELGHVLGIPDDQGQRCYCTPKVRCIMSSGPWGENPLFSNCSAASYFNIIQSGKAACLNNVPESNKIFTLLSCGNGLTEEEEDCDCGDNEQCKRCCKDDCTIAPGALCTTEQCCLNCLIAPPGMLCRKVIGECDLPEYCDGASLECPPDVYLQDGAPCRDNGYCYLGTCSTHTLQCRKIFGMKSQGGSLSCFQAVNLIGDRFGNCGGEGGHGGPSSFLKCEPENVLCGRIQCENVKTLPDLDDHTTIIQTPSGKKICWGLDYHSDMSIADIGIVEEGSKCGRDKVCINRTCLHAQRFITSNLTCDPQIDCAGNGNCNSHQNCHCKYGWAPPDCLLPGFGGSIDSGPVPRSRSFSMFGLVIGILVASGFVTVLAALLAVIVKKLVLRHRQHNLN